MFDYNSITAIAAVVASIVAIYAIWSENRRSNFILGMDLIMRLDDRFFGDPFKRTRQKAAGRLLSSDFDYGSPDSEPLDDVLDFFEMLAMLDSKKVLDKKSIWTNFFYWLDNYFTASKSYIAYNRKSMPLLWTEIDRLHSDLQKIREKYYVAYGIPTNDEIKKFLEYKRSLKP